MPCSWQQLDAERADSRRMRGNETAHSNIGICSLQHGFCRLFFRALTYFFYKEKTSGVTQKNFYTKEMGTGENIRAYTHP